VSGGVGEGSLLEFGKAIMGTRSAFLKKKTQ
jgi:hypothetical protein